VSPVYTCFMCRRAVRGETTVPICTCGQAMIPIGRRLAVPSKHHDAGWALLERLVVRMYSQTWMARARRWFHDTNPAQRPNQL
jgi:predicted DCC family thiol-disulfide oxidoreductase YuxK